MRAPSKSPEEVVRGAVSADPRPRDRRRVLFAAIFPALVGLALLGACDPPSPHEDAPGGDRPAAPAPGAPGAPVGERTLTILHTNDWHGYAFAEPDKITGRVSGGVVAIKAAIERIKRERGAANVLVLDGGDLLSGHPAASFVEDGVKGLAFCRLWDRIGFDAWAIGNHELDHGRDNLRKLVGALKSPALNANWLTAAPGGAPTAPLAAAAAVPAKAYLVFERAGLRVGVVGVITSGLHSLASKETLAGTAVLHPIDALKVVVPELEKRSDIQVALSHCGVEVEERFPEAVKGIDAVIGGHSHTFLREPRVAGGVPVCQAGQHGRVLGRLDLVIEDGQVKSFRCQLVDAPREGAEAFVDPDLVVAEAALAAKIEALAAEVIGESPAAMGRAYYGQSDLGGAVAETFRLAVEADLGIVNSGGVRADLDQGPVSRKELMEIMPFDNRVVVIRLTGAKLRDLVLYNARATATEAHGVLNFAGVTARWRRKGGSDVDLVEVLVRGKPIDPARTYACATSDYLLEQRAKYLGVEFPDSAVEMLELTVREAFERGIRAKVLGGGPYGVNADVDAPAGAPVPVGG